MEDLKTLYPEPPKEINLQVEEKTRVVKEEDIQMEKKALIINGLALIGAVSIVYTGLAIAAPDRLGGNALKGMEPTEQAYLERVERYCFNRLPMLNDRETCQVWANNYVKLVSGVDRPLDLFGKEVKTQISQEMGSRHKGWEQEAEAATVGNEQSPAKD